MVYPQTALDVELHMKFDGVNWTDLTQYLYAREDGGVTITRGRQDWSDRIDPATCTFLLDNRDGRFSPRNPLGPYYGQIGRNTPFRISVNQGLTYLDLPGGTGRMTTPDNATVSITGDIEIKVDYYLEDWDSTINPTELCGKYSGAGNRSWMLTLYQGKPLLYWSADGTTELNIAPTVAINPYPNGRNAFRVTFDVNNGAGGRTVTFYHGPSINGPWLQLGDPVVQAGTTSFFDNAASLDVGAVGAIGFPDPVGKVYAFELRNGIGGTVVANPDFTIQTAGATSFADAAGRTWSTSGTGTISNRKIRMVGEIPDWPLNQDTTGRDVYIEIQGAGRLRRMQANAQPLQSTLRKRIPAFNPLAYWPMEEGAFATSAVGLPDGTQPLRISTATWAANDTLVSSDPLPSLTINSTAPCTLHAPIPTPTTTPTAWECVFAYRLDTPNATGRTFMQIQSTGTVRQWFLQWGTGGATIIGRDGEGTQVFSQGIASGTSIFNTWTRVHFQAVQNGGNVDWSILWVPIGGVGGVFSASFAGTVGRPTAMASPPGGYSTDLDGISMGHFSVWTNSDQADIAYVQSDIAWSGETAKARFQRLASENSLDIVVRAHPTDTHTVGGQRSSTLYEVLQDTADVDGGILMEHRERNGLLYRDQIGLTNQKPRATLSYPGDIMPPLRPVDDDQRTKNDVTVSRTSAGSRRAVQLTGKMSVQEFPNGVGLYPDDISLPVVADDDCEDIASWRLHLGTVDEARYPVVNTWLQATPAQLDNVLNVDIGDRIFITTPNVRYQYDTIDLMVEGYTEFISQYRWEFSLNCVPGSPWDVAGATSATTSADTDVWSWADTTSTVLAEALTTTETDVDVFTVPTVQPALDASLWTSSLSDYPFLLSVGGETVRADAPGTFTNANPYFDTNSTGWTGINSSVARSTAFVISHPLALASLRVTPTGGGPTTAETAGPQSASLTVNPGSTITSGAWVYSPTGWASGVETAIDWYTSGAVYISTTVGTPVALVAGVWTYIEMTGTAPATAAAAAPKVVQVGSPTSADIYYIWGSRVCRTKASAVYDNFGRTDTDTWTTSDSKNTWTNVGTAADYDVLTGFGRHINTAASAAHHSVTAAPYADGDLYVDIAVAALSTGASQFAGALQRYVDVDNLYEARVEFTTGNAVNLTLRKRVATVETQLGTFSTTFTNVAGTYFRVRFQITGTALKAKIWNPAVTTEPFLWAIEVTDSALSAAGSVGLKSVRNAGNTNANAITQFDNFDLVNAQSMTVSRSYNGVVKNQVAGASISLRNPATAAL